jgi:hypothetical protein
MQSIGYATLAKLEPQYGLCKITSLTFVIILII